LRKGKSQSWAGLAVDLGASGGRVIIGKFDGNRLDLDEVHRQNYVPVKIHNRLHSNILSIYQNVLEGLRRGVALAHRSGIVVSTVGVDSWAADFGLLDRKGRLLGNPVHYRDARTDGMIDKALSIMSKLDLYRATGSHFMPFNTLYQIMAMREEADPQWEQAHSLLLIPDLLQYFLTGQRTTEYTNATTTQLFDTVNGKWSTPLLQQFQIDASLFGELVQPGTIMGKLLPDAAEEAGEADMRFVSVASHDTASAVAAIPIFAKNCAYLSSGTWSLIGMEVKRPIITEEAMRLNFTNEGGVGKTFRFQKNIMGLWLLQELKREWQLQGKSLSWEDIALMAGASRPFLSWIDPDDPLFMAPGPMAERVRGYCRRTGQKIPDNDGSLVRCMMESLAMKYKWTVDKLERMTGNRVDVLHMVGGGIRNVQLCEWTANVCACPVRAGLPEASASGNLMMQLKACGEISSVREGRDLLHRSFPAKEYVPFDTEVWQREYARFQQVIESRNESN
jgi:rhamnulokinase